MTVSHPADELGPATYQPSEPPLRVCHRHLPTGATLVQVEGVIDQRTAPRLNQQLLAEIHNCRASPPHIVLDLAGVVALNQTGLDTLLTVQTQLLNVCGSVELLDPTPAVIQLLHETVLAGKPER